MQSHTSPTELSTRKPKGAGLRYAAYGLGAVIVILAIAYIDGGQEPLHPIVQSVSLPTLPESKL